MSGMQDDSPPTTEPTHSTFYIPVQSPPTPGPSPTSPEFSLPSVSSDKGARTPSSQAMVRILSLLPLLSSTDLLTLHEAITPLLKRDFISDLPGELALSVLNWVEDPVTIARATRVCRRWHAICEDEGLWRHLSLRWDFERRPCPTPSEGKGRAEEVPRSMSWQAYFRRRYLTWRNWRRSGTTLHPSRLSSDREQGDLTTPRPRMSPGRLSSSSRRTSGTSDQGNGTVPGAVVTSCAIDEEWLVVGLSNAHIQIYNVKTGILSRTLHGHRDGVWGVALVGKGGQRRQPPVARDRAQIDARASRCAGSPTPDSEKSPLSHGLSESWRAALGLPTNAEPLAPGDPIMDENLSSDGASDPCGASRGWGQPKSLVVSAGCDRVVKVWDVLTGHCIYSLSGHTSTIRCLKILHNEPVCVTGGRDGMVKVWDIQEGMLAQTLDGHDAPVRCLDVCGGDLIVSGAYDTTARIWKRRHDSHGSSWECPHVLRGHFHQLYCVAFDSVGERVVTGGLDSTVRVWSVADGHCIALLQGHTSLITHIQIIPIPLSPSSSTSSPSYPEHLLLTSSSSGRILFHSLTTYLPAHMLSSAHEGSVASFYISGEVEKGRRRLVSAGSEGSVRVWDVPCAGSSSEEPEGGEIVECVRELVSAVSGGGPGGGKMDNVWKVAVRNDVVCVMGSLRGKVGVEIWDMKPR